MSTRGWYEYYTINSEIKQITLSMQFYKWGDATPGNALSEWYFFKDKLEEAEGPLTVHLLDNMLKNQLEKLYDGLPDNFAVATFLFMLQRASEFLRYENRRWANMDIPLKERPDYRLGYEIGKTQSTKNRKKIALLIKEYNSNPKDKEAFKDLDCIINNVTALPETMDEHINTVLEFIDTGNNIRPWKKYGLTFSVLEWLQYLTQITLPKDIGSIAGSYASPGDHTFLYRFFIWISREDHLKIDQIAIEPCNSYGDSLLSPGLGTDEDEKEWFQEIFEELSGEVDQYDIKIYSLHDAKKEFELSKDKFWEIKNYEYPELTEAALNYKYRKQ